MIKLLAVMMNKRLTFYRQYEIQRIRGNLERDGFPRLQMLLLVTLTGASGFVASYALLHAGLVEMWLRYLVAFGVAYMVFLALLWLWLRTRAEDYVDVPDPSWLPSPGSGSSDSCLGGKGGEFGGGGASSSYDGPFEAVSESGDSAGIVRDALDAASGADEFAIPLVILILVAAVVGSSLFIVYAAPSLFAELLVDGVLSASLYRRLRDLEAHHWLETAIRRTILPFTLTAAIVSLSGWGMMLHAPGAHSIGDVISHSRQQD